METKTHTATRKQPRNKHRHKDSLRTAQTQTGIPMTYRNKQPQKSNNAGNPDQESEDSENAHKPPQHPTSRTGKHTQIHISETGREINRHHHGRDKFRSPTRRSCSSTSVVAPIERGEIEREERQRERNIARHRTDEEDLQPRAQRPRDQPKDPANARKTKAAQRQHRSEPKAPPSPQHPETRPSASAAPSEKYHRGAEPDSRQPAHEDSVCARERRCAATHPSRADTANRGKGEDKGSGSSRPKKIAPSKQTQEKREHTTEAHRSKHPTRASFANGQEVRSVRTRHEQKEDHPK